MTRDLITVSSGLLHIRSWVTAVQNAAVYPLSALRATFPFSSLATAKQDSEGAACGRKLIPSATSWHFLFKGSALKEDGKAPTAQCGKGATPP